MLGTTVSHYEIREKLGAGGMGVVYKAWDTRLERWVALKFLPQHANDDPVARARFVREAKAASALEHPHICTIHEIGQTEDDQLFICMAYYSGPNLRQIIRSGNLTSGRALEIARQLCSALGSAHQEGILHRDLKPSNIMTTQHGDVAIVDFGLAKLAGEASITLTGAVMGTTAYMAPEQLAGHELDQRTDLWALGVILYELLTERHPFKGDYEQALRRSILEDEVVAPSTLRPEIPPVLDDLVLHLLMKDPGKRYSSAGEVSQLLQGSSGSPLDLERPTEIVVPTASTASVSMPPGRIRWLALLVVAILVIAMAIWSTTSMAPFSSVDKLAIIPFANKTGDPTQDYLTRGLDQAMAEQLDKNSGIEVIDSVVTAMDPSGAAALDPKVEADYVLIAHLEIREGRPALTMRLSEVGHNDPLFETTLPVDQGSLHETQNQLQSGILQALGLTPDQPPVTESLEAYDLFSRAQQRLGQLQDPTRIESALALLREAIRLDPGFALAHATASEALVSAASSDGDTSLLAEAESAALRALELDSRLPSARIALARVFRETDRNQEAIELLQRLVSAEPHLDLAYMELAFCYERAGDLAKAEANYRQASANRPDYWLHWNNLGAHLWMLGELDEARLTLRKAIEHSPGEITWALENLATLEMTVGNYGQALEVYELFPRPIADALTASNIGTLHYRLDQLTEAETYYRLALRLQPNDPGLHGNLADLLLKQGSRENAEDEYRLARSLVEERLASDPQNHSLQVDSNLYLAKSGECQTALDRNVSLEESMGAAPAVAHQIAQIYAFCGDQESALRAIARAIELGRPTESIAVDDEFDQLTDDPDFKRLLESDG